MDTYKEQLEVFDKKPHLAGEEIFVSAMGWMYGWVALGVVTTAAVSWMAAESGFIWNLIYTYGFWAYLVLIMGWIGSLVVLAIAIQRLPAAVTSVFYLAFTGLSGVVVPSIMVNQGTNQIVAALAITAVVFGTASAIGLKTKADLTGLGSICTMGILGLVAVSLVNMFFLSTAIGWIVSFIALPLFIGLTVWETKAVKEMAQVADETGDYAAAGRIGIAGAVGLYANLLNMFMIILRMTGYYGKN